MMRSMFCLIVVLAVNAASSRADDASPHVYRLLTNRGNAKSIELSGFKVKGREGLYTALHGVVGFKSIRAFHITEKKMDGYDMTIAEVDVQRDVAYLSVKGKSKLPAGGLALGFPPLPETLVDRDVFIVGYPMGIDELASRSKLHISKPAVSMLSERCPPEVKAELNERASPDLEIQIVRLDGHLLPGYSGAAVLDDDGAVIAIGNGGLDLGRVGLGWGIPFHDLKLKPVTDEIVQAQLARLADMAVNYRLFCIINDEARNGFRNVVIKTTNVIASKDGDPVLASRMSPKEAVGKHMNNLIGALNALSGKGEVPLEDALKLFADNTVTLANGTAVAIESVEKKSPAGQPFPAKELLDLQQGSKKGDPFAPMTKILGGAAEGMNVKVKVLDGPHKDEVLWVVSDFIQRKTEVIPKN